MREIVLDTETTGLDPAQGDRLVELGCIELLNGIPTGATFHAYINPEREVELGATRVHGLTREDLAAKPKFEQIAHNMLDEKVRTNASPAFSEGRVYLRTDQNLYCIGK